MCDNQSITAMCEACRLEFRRPLGEVSDDALCEDCRASWAPLGLAGSRGIKHDGEKPQLDLLLADMPNAVEAIGQVLTAGAMKYAPANWKRVENAQRRYLAAGMRHELALAKGQEADPETNVHHLAHVACCVLFRLELALQEQAS